MGTRPTDFPGLVIDPYRQCVVNQIELARFPVRVCECFSDCTNPGAPFPMLTECFIYGITQGDLEKGCPVITDGALGVTLGFLEAHFFVRLDLGGDTDFLQSGGTTANTAFRFNLYLQKPVGIYEVYLVDGLGNRAYISFEPSVGSILWVNIPLDDFTLVDAGFSFNTVRYVYFGFTDNFQVAECMMALDNVRICTNAGGISPLYFGPDSEPYGQNDPGDICVMLENFDSETALERVVCDATEPGPPSPEVCDECVIGPPLTNGNQATYFCVDVPGDYPPSIRYIPVGTFALVDDVTFTIYSWRPGVNIRVILLDHLERRAIYNFVAVGGSQTLTVSLDDFTIPDGGFDRPLVAEWWTIFGTAGVNSDDRFALDELKTNGGTTLINDMSTLADIYCGYSPEPQEPNTTMTCEWAMLPSVLYSPPTAVKFDVLTWTGPLTIATVSQPCDDPAGYWDLGFDDPGGAGTNHAIRIGFNIPVLPASFKVREVTLSIYDEAGREMMFRIYPQMSGSPWTPVLGDNLITFFTTTNGGQPTLESKGQFNGRRVMYWQLAFIGAEVDPAAYPFTINFEGFEFGTGLPFVATKAFLFNNYGPPGDPNGGKLEFEAKGGYSCWEDWRQVKVLPVNTPFEFLAGAGVTVDTDPAFTPTNIGIDRGKFPVYDDRTDLRTEVVFNGGLGFNPGFASGQGWNNLKLQYRARPDSGAPCNMWMVIRDVRGRTATYSFDSHAGGPPIMPMDQFREFSTTRSNFNRPMGDILFDYWRLFRVVKERTPNQPRVDVPPGGKDQFTGDELDFIKVETTGNTTFEQFSGKMGANSVFSTRDEDNSLNDKWYSLAAYGDDQPDLFDGHVHHETDCGWASGNLTGDPPPNFPYSAPGTWSPYHATVPDGWMKIYKFVEGEGVMRVVFASPIDLSAEVTNPLSFFQIFAVGENFGGGLQLATIADVRLVLYDGGGNSATIDLGVDMGSGGSGLIGSPQGWNLANLWLNPDFVADNNVYAMLFRLIEKTDVGAFDPSDVVGYELMTAHGTGDGWRAAKTWFLQDCYGEWFSPTLIYNWNRTTWQQLAGYHNPVNQFSVGKEIDPNTTPVVALNCDRTRKIAYWGMHEDWVLSADIVLVPAKYKDDAIVGINGNRGYDEFGNPLPGALEALARETGAWYGNIAFREPPFAGCRNIWMDLCYVDRVVCLGADMEKTTYEFWDTGCPCWGPPEDISNLVTDKWLDRILPDDQFVIEPAAQPLPSGYEEAIYFEYCALPQMDEVVEDDTDPNFTFKRETASCSKPDDPINGIFGHYVVKVTITAKNIVPGPGMTVNWADTLPMGETLISGVNASAINFTFIGEEKVFEYVVRTAQLHGGSVIISGVAIVPYLPNPAINLISPAIQMDVNCNTLSWNTFGSQSPALFAYGNVFWAGGGRPDPVTVPGYDLWTKVWAGPGSAGLSKREQYLFADATIPSSTANWTFQLGGTGVEGFAVGLPVWIFNTEFVDNPARAITGLDIEAEEMQADPNEEVTGLYGVVTAIDPVLMTVDVLFNVPPNQQVRFTVLAKACMMVAPDQSRGYYWEASPALVDLCNILPIGGLGSAELRWGFRWWNSTRNPAIETQGAGYICDGDGESYLYELHGEAVKDIINPVDWMDLLCSPVQETKLSNDALPTQDDIRVCDYCLFEPCSIVQIVDENCTGKEGSGPGYVGSVVSTTPDDPAKTCATLYAAGGHLKILPAIPVAVTGCGVIDGFRTTRRARAFVKPDVARYAYSPTTKVDQNGIPVEGQNFVGVDFATGTFTFVPEIVVSNPCVCYKALNAKIQLDVGEPGIYFLKGIDKSGCKSPPSKPIKIVGPDVEPEDCGIGMSPILLFHNTVLDPSEAEYGGGGVYLPIPNTVFNFSLAVPSRVEFRVSLFGWDAVVVSNGGFDITGWSEIWAHDILNNNYYPLADRLAKGEEGGEPEAGADSGAGSVISRVVDLPVGNYTFDLSTKTGGFAGTAGRIRAPIDIQVWKYGACSPAPPPPP